MIRTGTPIEVTSWDWEDVPVYDRHGVHIRYYAKVRVPREYKEIPYEQPVAEPIEDEEWVEF